MSSYVNKPPTTRTTKQVMFDTQTTKQVDELTMYINASYS